jgi:hypothetical protein
MADMRGIQSRLIGDSANDVARFNLMLVPNLNAVALQAFRWLAVSSSPRRSGLAAAGGSTGSIIGSHSTVGLIVSFWSSVSGLVRDQQISIADSHFS